MSATKNKDAKDGAPSSVDALEIGDRIDVTFTKREIANTGANANDQAHTRKHGRHRTSFGDGTEVTILSEPHAPSASADSNRSSDKK